MKKKVTIKQIARELDVSVSTVSKALRDSKEISAETREKVQAFARLLNYRPNNIAISLKNRKTRNIGVIIPEIVHHFFTTVISGIEREANKAGYNVIVCLSDESFDKEVINMETLANGSIDGFILSLSKETQSRKDFHHLLEAVDQGMPLVMFDRVSDEIPGDKVVIDDVEGAGHAVNYLLDSGCERIALLTTVDYVSVGKLRTEGYIRALQAAGKAVSDALIVKIEDIDNCEQQIAELFDAEKFDAVFAVNELFAVTAMKVAQRRGLKIPEDISFMGFTDGMLSQYAFPTLTTVDQHGLEMGEKAAQLLIRRLENDDLDDESFVTEIISTSIKERESTRTFS
ncbi:LacI family DNA-binding transcriptional regulator [Sinomicrobium soli]|uniref:LacI family DNA-binding transcriptional regulator n=1 Tax=Sinomicrobium sp. N-1-3-6 TaxID=2219864 RepID=UPI000DCC0562|nr:LacI family DNA-binding transcriptional regulator [Sinomicrobium sp. N-1-3-6]RAV31042.1 LacI family transcriptional regulator [Sinomicrobium sp. N-1-3-6]